MKTSENVFIGRYKYSGSNPAVEERILIENCHK